MIGIYKITNKVTGECYIGRSTNITNRFQQHKDMSFIYRYEKKIHPLYYDMNKYGTLSFSIEIMKELNSDFDQKKLNQLEFEYMSSCQSVYNKQPPIFDTQWICVAAIERVYIKIGSYVFDNSKYLKKVEEIRVSKEFEKKMLIIDIWRNKAKKVMDVNFNKKLTKQTIIELNHLLKINDLNDLK